MGIGVARKLRQTSTIPEVKLWQYLRDRRFIGLKFRRQFPVGPYVVDFVCLSHKLVIELDGCQHAEQLEYDNKRTEYLEHFGFRVLRFWNSGATRSRYTNCCGRQPPARNLLFRQ